MVRPRGSAVSFGVRPADCPAWGSLGDMAAVAGARWEAGLGDMDSRYYGVPLAMPRCPDPGEPDETRFPYI